MLRARIFLFSLLIAACAIAQDTTVVNFRRAGLSCHVDCEVNGFPVEFVFDTGAEIMSIPQRLATLMQQQDALRPDDYTGAKIEVLSANGSKTKGKEVVFREIKVGGMVFTDVIGVVMPSDSAGILLGQTLLSNLTSFKFDYERREITFIRQGTTAFKRPVVDCVQFGVDSIAGEPASLDFYLKLGIKDPALPWSDRDYEQAIFLLEALQEQCPGRLPTSTDPATEPLFKKLSTQPDLMAHLGSQATSVGIQVTLNNQVNHISTRLAKLYLSNDSLYRAEYIAFFNQQIYQYEEMSALIKRAKGNPDILPADTLEFLKDDIEYSMNNLLDALVFGELMMSTENLEQMARKLGLMLPQMLKQVGRPKFKANVREEAWVLSELSQNATVRSEMAKLFELLKPEKEEREVVKEREALMKLLRKNMGYTFACLMYDGQFLRSADNTVIEFRLAKFDPKVKLTLTLEKDKHRKLSGTVGRTQSKVYDMTDIFDFEYFEKVDLVVMELVKAN